MLGRGGIPVNIKDRKEVSKKGREKIRTKINLCGQNVQHKSTRQREKKNGKIEKWIVLKNCYNNYCTEVYKN